MTRLIPILLFAVILSSCGHPVHDTLSSRSPDGKLTINVAGEKQNALDPFSVTMGVKSGESSYGSLKFEIVSPVLDSSTVHFDWADAQNCTISYIQTDGEKRNFVLYASSTNVLLQEAKKD
jgi:hypothetical protein